MKSVLALSAALFAVASPSEAAERIVPLGGDVTEIVFALGEGARVVCVDQTSRYPSRVIALPQLGYVRTLAAEGILSCRPDVVVAVSDAGPPPVLAQLRDAGVPVFPVTIGYSIAAVMRKVDQVAAALGMPERGLALKTKIETEMKAVTAALAGVSDRPKVMFIMSHGPAGVQAAGNDTAAEAILTLAKARNVGADFQGYKPLSGEAAAALAPEIILVSDTTAAVLGGMNAVRARPEIALTPAGKNGRIIVVDTMLMLGFGPRTPQAVAELAQTLHPGLKLPPTSRP